MGQRDKSLKKEIKLKIITLALSSIHAFAMPSIYGDFKIGMDHKLSDYGSFVGVRGEIEATDNISLIYQAEASIDTVNLKASNGESYAGAKYKDHTLKVGSLSNVFLDNKAFGKVNPWVYMSAENGLSRYGRGDGSLNDSVRADANFNNVFFASHVSKKSKGFAMGILDFQGFNFGVAKIDKIYRGEATYEDKNMFLAIGAQQEKNEGTTYKDLALAYGIKYGNFMPMVSYAKGTGYTHRVAGLEYQYGDHVKIQTVYGKSDKKVAAISAVVSF